MHRDLNPHINIILGPVEAFEKTVLYFACVCMCTFIPKLIIQIVVFLELPKVQFLSMWQLWIFLSYLLCSFDMIWTQSKTYRNHHLNFYTKNKHINIILGGRIRERVWKATWFDSVGHFVCCMCTHCRVQLITHSQAAASRLIQTIIKLELAPCMATSANLIKLLILPELRANTYKHWNI